MNKLFKHIEKEGKIELTDDFKKVLTETVNVAVAEEKAKVDDLAKTNEELISENEELKSQIDELKENTLEEVKKEVESYKDSLVEKISAYLDSEMDKLIPEEVLEAVAKIEVYEPLVEGFKSTIAKFGIEIDSEGHELLKEAKAEIDRLRGEYDEITKQNVEMSAEMERINASVTLMEKCEGLTDDQKKKVVVIFKGKSADEINERFDEVRDMIVESTTEKETEDETEKDVKPVVVEEVSDEGKKKEVISEEVEDLGQKYLNF